MLLDRRVSASPRRVSVVSQSSSASLRRVSVVLGEPPSCLSRVIVGPRRTSVVSQLVLGEPPSCLSRPRRASVVSQLVLGEPPSCLVSVGPRQTSVVSRSTLSLHRSSIGPHPVTRGPPHALPSTAVVSHNRPSASLHRFSVSILFPKYTAIVRVHLAAGVKTVYACARHNSQYCGVG